MGRSVFLFSCLLALACLGRSDLSENVTLRQVWDGGTLLQLLYSGSGEPIICETSKGPELEGVVQATNLTEARKDCMAANVRHVRVRRATRHGKHAKPKTKPRHRKAKHRNHLAKGNKPSWKTNLITPGTKWCGPSNRARTFDELGPHLEADRCCRKHDQCQRYILGMSRGYNRINMSPFTLSHCTCDRRFRTCLKMAGTTTSNFVGKLFFNFVQTSCFVLKSEPICVERNWWGKCLKTEMQKLAHIRNNMAY